MRYTLLILCMVSSIAHANPTAPPGRVTPPGDDVTPALSPVTVGPADHETVPSYRWQIVAADAASVVLLYAAQYERTLEVSGVTYLGGGPVIHLAHGNPGRAATSLALRVGLPLLGGMIGNTHAHGDDFDPGVLVGMAVGAGVAMIADAAVIAPSTVERTVTRPGWSPQLVTGGGRLGMAIAGRF